VHAAILIGGSILGALGIWGFVWLMRLIPPGKGAAIDRFGDKPPPGTFDPTDFLAGGDGLTPGKVVVVDRFGDKLPPDKF
jgi:hypothetical protein